MPRFALAELLQELFNNSVGHKSEISPILELSATAENALNVGPVHDASGKKTRSTAAGKAEVLAAKP